LRNAAHEPLSATAKKKIAQFSKHASGHSGRCVGSISGDSIDLSDDPYPTVLVKALIALAH
jgi:hypothetical protein